MTIDASSVMTISIGAILAVLGAAVVATATWTRMTVRLDAIAAQIKELRSWHLRHTESAGAELDDAVEAMRSRHHQALGKLQQFEIRIGRLEHHMGIPVQVVGDHTPTPVDIPTGRHRRVQQSKPEESST